MAGITFSHPTVGDLNLRLAPTAVSWSYNVNTSTTPTYAGEVVQILSINIDNLTISGRFGKEGAHGRRATDGRHTAPRPVNEFRNLTGGSSPYRIGLTQMTEYFVRFFAVASQGRDSDAQGHYNQIPMTVTYQGSLDVEEGQWTVYPVSMPSYRRSNQDFAPEWKVECQVEEADYKIRTSTMIDEISRLRDSVGYYPGNRFSDPNGTYLPGQNLTDAQKKKAEQQLLSPSNQSADALFDFYGSFLPVYTPETLKQLIFASGPPPKGN